MHVICYDTFLLQQPELSHVHVCPLAHSPSETPLGEAAAHFRYIEQGERQVHAPARSRPRTHARAHARLFLCKHCRYARACCETRQPSPSAGGRAPSGSPAERSGGVNRATKICCTDLSCDSTVNRRVQIRFKAAGRFGSYTYLLCHAELNSEP